MTEELTIQLFFFSSALLAGFEAMKAGGWRVWAFGGLTALLAIFGLAWHSLKEIYPPLTIWVTEIATSPQSWFALIVIALVLIAMTGRRGSAWTRIQRLFGAPTTPSEEAASANGELEELKARLAEAEHRITKNDSALDMIRTAQGEIELGLVNARTNLVVNTPPPERRWLQGTA
jgi:hypothetical protein